MENPKIEWMIWGYPHFRLNLLLRLEIAVNWGITAIYTVMFYQGISHFQARIIRFFVID